MPQTVGTATGEGRSTFPLAREKGTHYHPEVNKIEDGVVHAHTYQTVLVEADALYKLWRDVKSAPLWQEHVVSVTEKSAKVSHWVLGNPDDADGKRLEFDSEIVEDIPGQKLSWNSITPGIEESGTVTFTPHPAGRGTVVSLTERIKVPGGAIASAVAGVVERSPKQTVIEDLRHFKELAETGEIPSVVGQPHGPRGITGGLKKWMFGETNPTPPGSSDQSQPNS